MNRSRIGAALLLCLLVAGTVSTRWLKSTHSRIGEEVLRAAVYSLENRREEALALTRDARERWEGQWGLTAALADHGPMEQIDALFAQLEVYAGAEDWVAFAGVCAQLGSELQALGDAPSLSWRNLLLRFP